MHKTNTIHTTLPALGRFKLYMKALDGARQVMALQVQGSLRDQLHRAVQSVVLNVAEGSAQVSAAMRKKHYRISRASLCEVAAVLDLLRLGAAQVDGKLVSLLRELDAMLGALLRRV